MRKEVFCGLALAALSAPSQAQEAPAPSPFTDSIDVRAIQLEVVVTDDSGQRVGGLSEEDFRLTLGGQSVAIDFFAEIEEGRVSGDLPAAVTNTESATARPAISHHYLIFIDETKWNHKFIQYRSHALRWLAAETDQLAAIDRVAVVSARSAKIRVLSRWAEPGVAGELLKSLAKMKVPFSGQDIYMQPPTDFGAAVPGRGPGAATSQPIAGAEQLTQLPQLQKVPGLIGAAAAAQHAFAQAPGRKLMLLLTQGWESFVPPPDSDLHRRPTLSQALTDTSNQLGFTLYPVLLLPQPGLITNENLTELVGFMGRTQALALHARQTGGRLLKMGGDRYLSRVRDDLRSYYWLGFTEPADLSAERGLRREIRVDMLQPGLQARTRKSYLPLPAGSQIDRGSTTGLLTGEPTESSAPQIVSLAR